MLRSFTLRVFVLALLAGAPPVAAAEPTPKEPAAAEPTTNGSIPTEPALLDPVTDNAIPGLREGRWKEAVEILRSVVAANPDEGRARYYLGAALERLGRHAEAIPELQAAIERGVTGNPTGMRSAHLALARSFAATEDPDRALAHLERAWARWQFDDLAETLSDEAFAPLHDDPRLRRLAGLDPAADAGDRDARWRADIRYLVRLVEAAHPEPFHTVAAATWRDAATGLEARVDELGDVEITAALARLMASIGDGHTALYPPTEGGLAWHLLPLFPYRLADGWYLAAASPAHADVVGAKILAYEGRPFDEIVDFAASHLARDNPFTTRWLAGVGLQFAEIYALASDVPDEAATRPVELTLELPDGNRVRHTFQPGPIDRDPNAHWAPAGWAMAFDEAPRWLARPDRLFHLEMLPGSELLYARLLQVVDTDERSLADAGRELREAFVAAKARGLLLDLRLNNGGDANEGRAFVDELLRIPALEEPGRFAVLVGPRSYSATGYLLGMFEKHLAPTFVGWPSGCRPVQYSSERSFRLPYSGLTGSISHELRVDGHGTDDLRPAFVPQQIVWPSGDDLRTGADPVLATAVAALRSRSR